MKRNFKWKIAQWFEIRWWKNYLNNKDLDYLKHKEEYWKDLYSKISDITNLREDDNIIDIGCGPAGIFMIFDKFGVDAVDPLVNQYDHNLEHFNKDKYPNVNFLSVPFEEFSTNKKYNQVFCMNAINHVANIDACLDKIADMTNNDGFVVISVDVHKSNFLKSIFKFFAIDILHPYQYTLNNYEQMIKDRNCDIVRTICLKKRSIFDYYLIVAKKR